MTTPVRFGVIGGGLRGSMFARVINEHPQATLVGFCESSAATSRALAQTFGTAVHDSVRGLLDAEQPDAVVVATPDFDHLGPGLASLERGVHVLFEKPLATSPTDARQLRDAAHASSSKVAIGFENRWNPKFQAARRLLATSSSPLIAQRALLQDTDFVPREMLSWAARSTPGWFLFPHTLDIGMWLAGATPVEVYARGVKKILIADGIDTYDLISASILMSDDSILGLDSGWVLPRSRPSVFQFRYAIEAQSEQLEIEIDRAGMTRYDDESVSYVANPETDARGRLVGAPIEMMRDFIDLCQGQTVAMPGIEEGYQVTVAIAALHESLRTNSNIVIQY